MYLQNNKNKQHFKNNYSNKKIKNNKKRITIIGCGVSGITMAIHSLRKGYDIIILEKERQLGGVWYDKNYQNIELQTTPISYSYSLDEFKSKYLFAKGDEIIDYLQFNFTKYNLKKHTIFNSKAISLTKRKKQYTLGYKNNNNIKYIKSDYVVFCCGVYNIPKLPNSLKHNINNFSGFYDHSQIFSNKMKQSFSKFKDKDVVIIGNGSTGCDLAVGAVEAKAKSVTILFRSHRWVVPKKIEIGEFEQSLHYFTYKSILNTSWRFPKLALLVLSFLMKSSYIFNGLNHKLKLPKILINRNNISLNDKIFDLIYQNKINYIQDPNWKCKGNYIETKKGNIKCDILIAATGYSLNIPILNTQKMPLLYKRVVCLEKNYEDIGFIGYAPSFNWMQVSDLQARWYLHYIENLSFTLTKKQIENKIQKDLQEVRKKKYNYYDLSYILYDYCDDLAKDINPKFPNSLYFTAAKYNNWSDKKILKPSRINTDYVYLIIIISIIIVISKK